MSRWLIQLYAGLIAGFLIENNCVAWNVHKASCNCHPMCRQVSKRIRSPLVLLAADGIHDGNDNTNESTMHARDDAPTYSGDLYNNLNDEVGVGEGIFLDAETYLQAESLLQPDGSLDLDFNTKATKPKVQNPIYQSAADALLSPQSYPSDGMDPTNVLKESQRQLTEDEMLLQAMQRIQNPSQRIDPEVLHQQVFAEEQVYLQQSEEFRKSLSTLFTNEAETPMAKARREAIQSYNDGVLEDLMKDIDEMEKIAPSREEAMKLARAEAPLNNHVLCSKCGCRVTPDVIERFERMKAAQESGAMQYQKIEMICDACYGSQFRSTNEAQTRLGVGLNGDYSSARMWEKKPLRPRRDGDQSKTSESFLDTSSLFQMPTGYGEATSVDPNSHNPQNRTNRSSGSTNKRQMVSPQSREFRRPDQTGRTMQAKSDYRSSTVEKQFIRSEQYMAKTQNRTGDMVTTREDRLKMMRSKQTAKPKSTEGSEEWVKVTDPKSQRMFYWNKSTGEMRKRPPE